MEEGQPSIDIKNEFIACFREREGLAEASASQPGDQALSEPDEDVTPIASPPGTIVEPTPHNFGNMLEAWLEEEDNRNRLIEKIGLRRDIDEINDKMSEILNSMEVLSLIHI